MKTKLLPILRYIVLALLLLCIVLCRFFPVMAEGYARHIYPWLSAALSAIASVFPFFLGGGAGGRNHFMDDYLSFS